MILYPETSTAVKSGKRLEDLLTMEMATYLCWYDQPVAGAKLHHLGVMARAFIGTLMNQPNRPWGQVTELAKAMVFHIFGNDFNIPVFTAVRLVNTP